MTRLLTLSLSAALLVGAYAPPALAAPAEEEEASEVPSGCFKDWLCYLPPSGDDVHPELSENGFKSYLAALLLFPSAAMWPITDAAKRPLLDEDILTLVKATWIPMGVIWGGLAVSYLLCFTVIGFPLGYLGLVLLGVASWVNLLYIRPMTQLHVVNRALTRDGKSGGGKTKARPAKKGKRKAAVVDDEE